MIFTDLLTKNQNDFKLADKYVKYVDDKAEYYIEDEYGVLFLTSTSLKEITKGNEFGHYINELGQIYKSCYTNKYNELVKYYNLFAKTYEQLQFEI